MKILVTGANGLLGQHLVKPLLNAGHQVLASGKGPARITPAEQNNYKYAEADITDEYAIERLMNTEKPEVVIHAAAMTQVDICEQHRDRCSEVNVQGTANLLLHAEKHSSFIIYVSTDFVFDGEEGNYSEEDEGRPVNWYGFTKMEAEGMIAACAIPWVIVRTCLVYGNTTAGARGNIITWVREKLANGEKIKVVDDQLRTPTYVGDLAKGILLIAEKKTTGIFHISGEERLTPYQMAVKTAAFFGLDKNLIERVNATTFTQPARRPAKTGFNIEKAKRELGYWPMGFMEGLKRMYGL